MSSRTCGLAWVSKTHFRSVQLLSCVRLFETPWIAIRRAFLSITNSWRLLKLMPIESVMPSNNLILRHPLLLLPTIFPSITVFSNELVLLIKWPKYWSFTFNVSPCNEYSGLTIWSLVPLPFINPAWTSEISQLTYCWSLVWRILSIPLLTCEMSAIIW